MYKEKRNSGRTTNLIAVAKYLSRQGNDVVIVAANQNHKVLFYSQITSDEKNITIRTPNEDGGFCWETMSFRGYDDDCVFLVDHYTIESRFRGMLDMLHAFDK